jgi:hypothetical protein
VPSPLDGDYKGGQQCEGEFVEGVFFLAGTTGGDAKRTCTVLARTALFFPAINYFCTADEVDIYPECAAEVTDTALANGSPYATLDRKNLEMSRIATGPFTLIIPEDNIFGVPGGPYPFPAVSDGLWVYLPKGLEPGNYKVEFGGASVDPRGVPFSLNVTYKLKVV